MPYIEAKTPVGKTLLSTFFSVMAFIGLIGGMGGNGGAWIVFLVFGVCAFLAWQNTLAHQRSLLKATESNRAESMPQTNPPMNMTSATKAEEAELSPTRLADIVQRLRGELDKAFQGSLRAKLVGKYVTESSPDCCHDDARIQSVADRITNLIAGGFSSELFTSLFEKQTLVAGRTFGEALGIWYSLGNLSLLVGVAAAINGSSSTRTDLLGACAPLLVKKWQMSRQNYQAFASVLASSMLEDVESFQTCNSGDALFRFFSRYVDRILGHSEARDPILCLTICQIFVSASAQIAEVIRTEGRSTSVAATHADLRPANTKDS